jgi:hypothetical protein
MPGFARSAEKDGARLDRRQEAIAERFPGCGASGPKPEESPESAQGVEWALLIKVSRRFAPCYGSGELFQDMSLTVEDFCVVADRAEALGLLYPRGLAILPRNFDSADTLSEIVHEDSTATIRKLFRQQGIQENQVEKPGQKLLRIQENAADLLLPTLFVTASLYSENPYLVPLALNILSEYAMDFFKGSLRNRSVDLSVVVERDEKKVSKRIRYKGDVSGMKDLESAVRKLLEDEA